MAVKTVEDANRRKVTFTKRKAGLFNKLTELSILCKAETALIIASPNDKLYVGGYPSADAVIRRYLTRGPPVAAAGNMNQQYEEKLETFRAQHDAVHEQLKEEKQKRNPQDLDGVEQFKKSLESFRLNMVMMMQNNCHGSNSTDNSKVPQFPPQPDNCHGGWQQVQNDGNCTDFECGSTSSDATLAPFPPSFDGSSTSGTVMLTPPGFSQFLTCLYG